MSRHAMLDEGLRGRFQWEGFHICPLHGAMRLLDLLEPSRNYKTLDGSPAKDKYRGHSTPLRCARVEMTCSCALYILILVRMGGRIVHSMNRRSFLAAYPSGDFCTENTKN